MDSPYDVLGIDSDADEEEITRAYRRLVKEVHPDQDGSAREFQLVNEAYEQLRSGDDRDERALDGDPHREQRRESLRVEYLDYEVLDDHGWDLDGDPFETAAAADLDPEDHGEITVEPDETLLEAAENSGLVWPFACRGGACSNCAVAVIEGEIPPPTSHVLPPNLIDRGIRLSCITAPISDDAKVVYNVKHLPEVEELLLSDSRFKRKHATD